MKQSFKITALTLGFLLSIALLGHTPGRSATLSRLTFVSVERAVTSIPLAGTSTVNLNNRNWNRVTVEVRMGDDPNPEANRSLGSRTLSRGETWSIQSQGEDLWYRRDADPDHHNGLWTAWTHRPCYPSQSETYNENL